MFKSNAWLAAIVVLATAGRGAEASPKTAARRPVAKAAAQPKMGPVDILIGTVMLNTAKPGDNLYDVCRTAKFQNLAYALQGMKGFGAPKTEFETQAQYEQRSSKLTDAINGSGQIVVCQDLSDNEDVTFSYDPETEVFKGSFNPTLAAWRATKKLGSYVSKTRMGVRATIQSSTDVEFEADMFSFFSHAKAKCISSGYTSVSFTVPSKQADAPQLKAAGRLVIFGRIIPPYYSEEDQPGAPTIDSPYDIYTRHMTVPFQPAEMAVIDMYGAKVWSCPLAG